MTGTVDPKSFIGAWKSADLSARDALVTIDEADPAVALFSLSITISGAPECNGGDLRGKTSGSPVGASMAASWALTCTSAGSGATFGSLYTFDPATGQLTDNQEIHYSKQ